MVEYEQRGRVGLITIRRPEARNAINVEVAHGIEDALDKLEDDESTWAAVLAAEGPVFCAGADLKVVAAGGLADLFTDRGGFAGIAARSRAKPLIAAVDGPALAGGCEVALACDLIVASTSARFGLPEVKRSLVAAGGGLFRLTRVLPRNVALELILTGDPIDAARAYALGMVNRLVEPGEALTAALALAGVICENAPVAVQESRRTVVAIEDADEETARQQSLAALARVMQSEDFAEGPRAFVEKRPPQWTGR